jgi:hypothetical protein
MKSYLLVLIPIAILAIGCGDTTARSLPPATISAHAGVGYTLTEIGVWLLWISASAITLGTIGVVGSFFISFLLALRDVFIDAIIAGLALLLVGSSINYLGQHPWLLAVIIGLVGVVLVIRNLPAVEAFLGIAPNVTVVSTVTTPLAKSVLSASSVTLQPKSL